MSREIKFRAWLKPRWDDDEDAGKMYYDIQDSYDTLGDVKPYDPMDSFNGWLDDEVAIVEQYTGLKDKNGKEIYEGDIVKITRELTKSRTAVYIYQIKYDGSRAAFACWKNNHFSCMFFESNEGECEVIGNIHEPPKDFRPEHLKRMGVSISKGGEE